MKKHIITIIVLVLIGILVVKNVNIPELIQVISSFSKLFLAGALFCAILLALIKSVRMAMLLEMHHVKIPRTKSFLAFLTSQAFTILPGGEIARAKLLFKEAGKDMSEISAAVVMQAVIELFTAIAITAISCFFFKEFLVLGIIASILVCTALVFLLHPKLLPYIFKKIDRFKIVKTNMTSLLNFHQTIRDTVIDKNKPLQIRTGFLRNVLMAMLSAVVGGAIIYLIAKGFNANLNLLQAIFVYAASTSITGLSGIIPGGLGVTEGGMSGLLLYLQFSLNRAIGTVIIYRSLTLLLSVALGIILYGVIYKFNMSSEADRSST